MPPKPTSEILFALDNMDGKAVERKESPVAETGKAPRLYSPPIFPSAPATGKLTQFRLFADYSDRKLNPPYLVIREPAAPGSPKPL